MAPQIFTDRNARGAAVPDEHLLPTIKTVTWFDGPVGRFLSAVAQIYAAGFLVAFAIALCVGLRRMGLI